MNPVTCNDLEVRLAESESEIEAAQRLRYEIFYEEMGARASDDTRRTRRDADSFDAQCDHLLVVDRRKDKIVGTYRLLNSRAAREKGFSFYTETEYDIGPIKRFSGETMELGRSCVHADYRTRSTLHLLWRGLAEYIADNDVEIMFGCGSFHGTDLDELAHALSYLHYNYRAPAHIRPRALDGQYVDMALVPPDEIDQRQVLRAIPPLIKGYLRAGGFVGDGAVIDRQFNTTDVCIIVKLDQVTDAYLRHFKHNSVSDAAE